MDLEPNHLEFVVPPCHTVDTEKGKAMKIQAQLPTFCSECGCIHKANLALTWAAVSGSCKKGN